MPPKYKKGERITSIDEMLKQEFIYWNNKITHKGWFKSWQLRMTENAIKAGRIYKAIKNESEETQEEIMYEKLNVRIKSIIPNDKFNVVGKEGFVYKGLIEIDKRLLIMIGNKGLRTSLIKSVTETADEIEVKTMNSVYTLEKIKEEI